MKNRPLSQPWFRTLRGWRRLFLPRLILPRPGQLPQGWAIHFLLAAFAGAVALCQPRRGPARPAAPRRAVFVTRAHLGDFLMSVPALVLFKESLPGCHAAVVLQGRYHQALDLREVTDETFEGADETLSFRGQVRWWLRFFRKGRFDAAIFHRITRPDLPALLASFLAGVPYRMGGADKGTQALLTHCYFPERRERVVRYHLNLVAAFLGLPAQDNAPLSWPGMVPSGEPPQRYDIVAVPYAQHSKTWNDASWRELFAEWSAQGRSVAVVGAAGQAAAAEALARDFPGVTSLAGTTDLPALFRLVGAAHCMVAVDTGVRHVAAALGVPCVVLGHGREHRAIMGAYVPGERYVVTPVPCAPCGAEPCPLGHVACIRKTPVAAVREALADLAPFGPASGD